MKFKFILYCVIITNPEVTELVSYNTPNTINNKATIKKIPSVCCSVKYQYLKNNSKKTVNVKNVKNTNICPKLGLNQRPLVFQTNALPTELFELFL